MVRPPSTMGSKAEATFMIVLVGCEEDAITTKNGGIRKGARVKTN